MPTPHPPRPFYPPGGAPGESDESLAARLRGRTEGEATQSVALLMARHWQPTYDYAAICLASSSNVASMVAATSFHYALDCLIRGESGAALRPRLLVTVRDTVNEWSGEDRISGVLPDLRKPAGGRGMRAAQSITAENRKLAERSFQALPPLAQCLLWHTEVEAEDISVPAGLSGLDVDTASAALEQAREQFRQGCVRAHRELAPSKECGFYNRLLDVPIRRGGALLPDVRQHLGECRHCRHAAEQLGYFEGGLGLLLAEAVLGWGARRYLDARPGRGRRAARPEESAFGGGRAVAEGGVGTGGGVGAGGRLGTGGRPGSAGRHRLLARIPAPGRLAQIAQKHSKVLLTGAGTASAVLLVTVLTISLWSHGEGGADPTASTGVGSSHTVSPSPVDPGPSADSSPTTSAGLPTSTGQTRLRNLAADLCLDIRGGKAETGAEAELAVCSSAWTQQWSYESDGLLRSVADPALCLDSHADDGVVALDRCVTKSAARGGDVRYDLTVRGELLSRSREGLAVTPSSTDPDADIVVKDRDGSDAQRWRTDTASADPGSLSIAGTAGASTRPVSRPPSPRGTTEGPSASPSEPPTDGRDGTSATPSESSAEPRSVTVDDRSSARPALPLTAQLSSLVEGLRM
ncbi:RICIN domain-containing protein [Streptomyces sp. AK02-04a]|uniref:RICIN domain-containing protein n=1 Tax=Streptomyces sp. AK02-04a TaxID=3028649 RepID=UPI0029AEE737|nr:RICIN domain-containing protein [Streptomyces sp. AK02-04a]MDX3759523.1 RICIN domain-containing protein [Streptomyces sp. AK02-04a]